MEKANHGVSSVREVDRIFEMVAGFVWQLSYLIMQV